MKTISIIFIVLIVSMECVCAKADSILLGAYSYHFQKSDRELNDNHQMIGIEYRRYVVGRMKNSFNDETYFAGYRFTALTMGDFDLLATVGANRGYKNCNTHRPQPYGADPVVCPMIVPELLYTKYKIQPALIVFGRAIAISTEIKF